MYIIKTTLILLLTFVLIGCESMGDIAPSKITSNIEVFHQLKPSQTYTYNMMPFKEQEGKLEYSNYANKVRSQLNSKGYIEANPDKADVIVFIEYGIDDGKEVLSSYPIWGQTGVASSTTYGTVGSSGNYSGTTYNNPTYGVVGSGTTSDTVYKRFFKLEMVDNKSYLASHKLNNVYEAKVTSTGTSNSLTKVFPYMLRSLFEDFPNESGTMKQKSYPFVDQ